MVGCCFTLSLFQSATTVQHRSKLDPHWLIVSCPGCKLDPGWLLLHPVPLSVCHHGVLQKQAKTPTFQVKLIPHLKTYIYILYIIIRGVLSVLQHEN
jgi:hypothetical protein